jgi:hypothetical protein
MIYSYNSELSNNFYDPRIFTNTDLSNSDLSNIMFLSINNSNNSNNTNTNNQSLCGLTKKNLYNNIFFDENQRLIFYNFNKETIVNYQVNSNDLRLEDTLNDEFNNDNYLIDICVNDIYRFNTAKPLTFNTLRDLSYTASYSEEYNFYIAFTLNDELTTDSSYVLDFNIRSIYLNNMPIIRSGYIYREYSEYPFNTYNSAITELSYNDISNRLSSHSYLIELNDYFDLNIFKDKFLTNNSFSTDFIDTSNLKYRLLDVS